MLEWIRFGLSATCIVIGLFVFIVGIIGIYQFKFVVNRMHSAAMLDTMGLFFIALGAAIAQGFDPITVKILIVVLLLWITSPIASHLIVRIEYFTDENLNDEIENELSETKAQVEEEDEENGNI